MDVNPKPGFNFGVYQNPIFKVNFKDVPFQAINQFAGPVLSPNEVFANPPKTSEDERRLWIKERRERKEAAIYKEQQKDRRLQKNTKAVLCALVKMHESKEEDLKFHNKALIEEKDRLMRSETMARREADQLSKDNEVLNDKVRILQSELSKVRERNDALTRDVTALQMNLEGKRARSLEVWVEDDRKKARIDNNE